MSAARMQRSLKIGLVQMAMAETADANQARAEQGIREAAGMGAELICLPELYRSRYFCQTEDAANFDLAEEIPGATTQRLATLAAELDVALVASLFERRAAGVFHNTAAVIDGARGYLGKYRKMHIPDDPRYHEKFYFTPGDLGFKSFHTHAAELGVLVCWDQWYPEAARLTALRGAEVLLYPTAIGWHPEEKQTHGADQHAAWETIQRSHAIANGCFVLAASSSGARASSRRPTGASCCAPPRTAKPCSSRRSISLRSIARARGGRFFATGASMRTARSPSVSSMAPRIE
jgi:N-carbamoylputrescine amidase